MSDIHALSGAYAVDALDEHERAQFERHLADCADCRAEVDSLRSAAASLADATAVAPPPQLRADVLAAITKVRPLPPLPVQPPAIEHRGRRFPRFLVAAAAVAAVGTGLVVTQPWEDELSAVDQIIAAADSDRDSVRIDGGKATVYRSESLGQAALVTSDLPAVPSGKVYELWLQIDGAMVPAGLLKAAGDQEFLLTGDAAEATAAGITIEPAGGSKQPTTTPIALFDLTQDT